MATLEERVSALEDALAQDEERLEQLNSADNVLSARIDELEGMSATVNALEAKYTLVYNRSLTNQNDIKSLKERVATLEDSTGSVAVTRTEFTALQGQVTRNTRKIRGIENAD